MHALCLGFLRLFGLRTKWEGKLFKPTLHIYNQLQRLFNNSAYICCLFLTSFVGFFSVLFCVCKSVFIMSRFSYTYSYVFASILTLVSETKICLLLRKSAPVSHRWDFWHTSHTERWRLLQWQQFLGACRFVGMEEAANNHNGLKVPCQSNGINWIWLEFQRTSTGFFSFGQCHETPSILLYFHILVSSI